MNKTTLEKNFECEVVIENFGMNGEGVAHVNGEVVFVPFAIPGERVKIKIINAKSKIAVGKILEIIEPSDKRVKPRCPYFGKCGGCDIQHLDYVEALKFKQQEIAKNMVNIAKIGVKVNETVRSLQFFYRNKCSLPVVFQNGETFIGMFRENSHLAVKIDDCVVTQDFCKPLIGAMNEYIKKFKISGYNEETQSGQLRHIVARKVGENVIITLVSTTVDLPGLKFLYEKLKENFNCSLWLNVNEKPTNVIFGNVFECVFGEKEMYAQVCGLKVSINPASFMQVNDEIRDKIYYAVQSEISSEHTVIDAYSGAGVIFKTC